MAFPNMWCSVTCVDRPQMTTRQLMGASVIESPMTLCHAATTHQIVYGCRILLSARTILRTSSSAARRSQVTDVCFDLTTLKPKAQHDE